MALSPQELKQIEIDSYKTESEILQEILDQFQNYEEALEDVMDGTVPVLTVKGPPGTGKSEGVEIASRQAGIVSYDHIASEWERPSKDELKAGTPLYPYHLTHEEKIQGALMRGADYGIWQLVTDLHANKDGGLICLDDNDEVLKDNVFMALLMKATEQKAVRPIVYGKASSTQELLERGVKPRFNTEARIIILSNIDFEMHIQNANEKEAKTGKPKPGYISRWEALMQSRGKYIDLKMNTPQRIRIFCEHKIRDVKMLENSGWLIKQFGRALTNKESEEVLAWVRKEQPNFRQKLDLRVYQKIAAKYLKRNKSWQESARIELLKAA